MRRLPEPPLALIVFVVGSSILGAEIAAARLLAPYFGASTIVWANTIGIVLVALSIGYWYGGKLADRNPTREGLYRIVLLSGLLLAAVPFVADPFLGVAVDALDSISAGAFVGSLLGVTVLVATPDPRLGRGRAVRAAPRGRRRRRGRHGLRAPVRDLDRRQPARHVHLGAAVHPADRHAAHVRRLRPRCSSCSPSIGLAPRALRARARRARACCSRCRSARSRGETDAGARVIHEADTEYQYARVVQDADGTRTLELNEGQAVHSMRRPGIVPDRRLLGRVHARLPFAAQDRPPRSIAILGNAAGTTARAYGHYFPQTRIDAVEIDGELTEIGRRYFDLRGAAAAHAHRRRAAVPAPHEAALRRDRRRRLPPAVHPVLPRDARVLRARPRPAAPGRRRARQRRPSGAAPTASSRSSSATMAAVFPTVLRDPSEATNTLLLGDRRRARRRSACARTRAALPRRPAAARAGGRRAPGAAACAAGASTPTTSRRSSGSIDTSIVEVAAEGER